MREKLFKLWVWLLNKVHREIDKRIKESKEIYVVFFNEFNKEVFICPNGDEALKLVDILKTYHEATNKMFIKVLYGKASDVFKFKHLKVLDCKFTWNATPEERQNIIKHMADSPLNHKKD